MITLLLLGLAASPASTDFGIRSVGGSFRQPSVAPVPAVLPRAAAPRFSLARASSITARLGRVTSTWRSPSRNRQVGGAANSWHLHGRAIDVVRAPGVSHERIASELRAAGFYLIESLDEGDHSHFAFADGPVNRSRARPAGEQLAEIRQEARYFRFVMAPSSPRLAARR